MTGNAAANIPLLDRTWPTWDSQCEPHSVPSPKKLLQKRAKTEFPASMANNRSDTQTRSLYGVNAGEEGDL
jgi:hypothetical protein